MASLAELQLVLFFTRGISLRTWAEVGMFEREIALYQALRPHLRSITMVTYGDATDLEYGEALGDIRVVCNRWKLPRRLYASMLSRVSPRRWKGPTVVKSNQVGGADVALRAAQRCGGKYVARCGYLRSFFMEQRHGPHSPQAERARSLEQTVFRAADRVVVTTPAMREAVLERYAVPAERMRVIPNYVLTGLFRPEPRRARTGRRLCFVGRLSEQKNLFALLEATKGIDVELDIVGGGNLEGQIREKVRSDGLRVRLLGQVPHRQLPEIMNNADAFVLPSLYEGHPKTLIEAMSCGLPVIGTDVPGIRELIRHRETGYLCGTSPEEIRAAIEELLADPGLRARLGERAREFIVSRFSLARVVELELALLRELAE